MHGRAGLCGPALPEQLVSAALLAAALLPACAIFGGGSVRHAPPGLHGTTIFLACSSPPAWHEPFAEKEVCDALFDAFAESGLEPVLEKSRADLGVQALVSFHGDWVEYSAAGIAGGKSQALDQARFDREACGSLATGGESAKCIARKIVADVALSRPIASWAATRRPAAPQTGVARAAASATPPRAALTANTRLAVLELRSKLKGKDAEQLDCAYFADLARGAALRALPGVQVITKENLLVLLEASGKKPEECEGECEVETGRLVGADYVVSGEALRVGSHFKINLKLHETKSARLVGQVVASGHGVEELDADTQRAVGVLVQPLQ